MRFVLALAVVLAPGCSKGSSDARPDVTAHDECEAPDVPAAGWRHPTRAQVRTHVFGDPAHSADDPIVNPGDDAVVRGKFAYGSLSKDLEDEKVSLWLRRAPCGPWDEIDSALTDDDGRVSLRAEATRFTEPGSYPFRLVVAGDGSQADGAVWVVPRGTQAVVFDIDGTLTTGDRELVREVALGRDARMRPGADAVARVYAEAGYLPIYITGRPYALRGTTAAWLEKRGFPRGPLVTTDSLDEAAPGEDHVGAFKTETLRALIDDRGVDVVAAYGNASTDVCAYARAGVAAASTYIASAEPQRCGDSDPTQPLTDWEAHARHLTALPPAKTPARVVD